VSVTIFVTSFRTSREAITAAVMKLLGQTNNGFGIVL